MTTLEIILLTICSIFFVPTIIFLVILLRSFVIESGFVNSLCFKDIWLSYAAIILKYDDNNDITPFGRMIIKGLIAVVLFPFTLLLYLSCFVFIVIFLVLLPIELLIEVMFVNKKHHFISQYRRCRQKDKEWARLQKKEE